MGSILLADTHCTTKRLILHVKVTFQDDMEEPSLKQISIPGFGASNHLTASTKFRTCISGYLFLYLLGSAPNPTSTNHWNMIPSCFCSIHLKKLANKVICRGHVFTNNTLEDGLGVCGKEQISC